VPELTDEGNVMSAHAASEAVTSDDVTSRPPAAVISPDLMAPLAPGRLADQALAARVARYARCADSGLDPDEWFPVSIESGRARQEAAAAIAVCAGCLVRGQCLALSLRHWGIGKHGVWGGLVAADRARLRARLAAGPTSWPADPAGRDGALAGRAGSGGQPVYPR
jgi:hypothetical protein